MDGIPLGWARAALQFSRSASSSFHYLDDDSTSLVAVTGDTNLDDPGKDPRFRKLVEVILYGRRFIVTYNVVLLGILLIFATWHWGEKVAWARKRRALAIRARKGDTKYAALEEIGDNIDGETSSSSSSTLEGTATPPDATKVIDDDDERKPLLPQRKYNRRALTKFYNAIQASLMYQPKPLPLLNRALPTNIVSLVVIAFVGLNLFYNLYGIPFDMKYLFVFADRAGLVFVANLPLLYLFAAKNQPIKWLTGYSYESLNIFHRRLGELMCFEALLHFAGMLTVWYGLLRHLGLTLIRFLSSRLVLLGLGAFVAYELIYFTSLGSFRQRWYELFLFLHVTLQVAALVLLWLHYHTSRPYVGIALGIFLIDRLLFRLGLKTTTFPASLTVLEDGETILISSNWDIVPPSHALSLSTQTIKHGWAPTDHIFLTIPSLSPTHILQAHPYTIFSAAPPPATSSTDSTHAWLTLLIRAQSGFTRTLLHHAHTHPTTSVRLDGPYGSPHALHTLKSSQTAVIIAGGSGIAVAFPLLWALLAPPQSSSDPESASSSPGLRPKVHLLWITHSRAHRDWLPDERLAELRRWGLDARIPALTEEAGRPDVKGIVREWVEAGGAQRAGVVVSGPDGMNRDVRNACAGLVGEGRSVSVVVEKFGW